MTNVSNAFDEQKVLAKFLEENTLFHAPDPEIMEDHRVGARNEMEESVLSKGMDPHLVNEVRGRLLAALDESNTMIEQMGAAPGAKWGDIVAAIFTANGDLSMISPHGVVGFAGCCHYPIKFISKYWKDDPTVGIRDGDGFIHNDARYGGIHNTDQSTIVPLFWKGKLVAWLSATIHEGENGACEPGGMPAAAESKFDEGLKMSPFKIIENFQIRRDLQTFLQNSVRDPKLQYEDMKVKLHSVLRLRERVLKVLEEFGEEALIGTLRKNLEDVEVEVRRRIAELPDGTTRVVAFPDSTLRENVLMKFNLAVTVKGDRMLLDFRGSSPEFLNRSINTNQASFKTILLTCFLQNIWPDLPQTLSILSPMDFIFDEKSVLNGSFDTPQAMSLIPLFKAMTLPTIPMAKLSYMLPHRYTSIVAPQYDQPATLIYGGLTQHTEQVGNFCADINGNGQGGRANADGEHSISPPFAAMCDIGEMELIEEEIPIVRLGAFTLAKDRVGFGMYRGGLGYEQIATTRGTGFWGFMTGCTGSVFTPSQPLFGGYGPPVYPLCKIRNIDIFEKLKSAPENINFDIIDLMNNQPIEGATYSTHDMGMTFELVQPGEVYMICQGGGSGYGDVLLRDPALVAKDLEEELISHETALDIYKVIIDPVTHFVDEIATKELREAERRARIARGKSFDDFIQEWNTAEPPAYLPYFGSWDDRNVIYGVSNGQRIRMDGDKLNSMFMPNPKDVLIGELQAELSRARLELAKFGV
ncbi:MAG: acetone carboxylase subunit alpha [Betaproteobacteria bacterium HGW-Betaproteobacteria-5]|jgi:N-methylhydantoinase B/oxoprolinase/acetone carboxylase alpha subunit|nr:MAG: acetone carboxylase subunit alpha [Betaproteobacteria bacterium HGW-Betaproteobacteria-5]PKO41128.1 MAG: acetone carboxylase subunit alpha [Betaproteobacteria bacterium HGW-Betaproteobacteria-6]